MPEIGEVARIVNYLRKHVVGRRIKSIQAQDDTIVYGKAGTSGEAFAAALTGKKVLDARQQGKYFWLEMSSPPHPLMHLGMTGWIKFSKDDTSYYRPKKEDAEPEPWPPKFWKFIMKLEGDDNEVAFVDPRRLGRIRLVQAEGKSMRKTSPLKENGPDPYQDKDILTLEWLKKKMASKKVPVKALLLDQANISGVGNWVGDEILYQAKLHPEQYSNTFDEDQLKRLHDSLIEVCTIAIESNAESDKFPENWLMKHRWGKGKKNDSKLPTGEKIEFIQVGGRTSAFVPSMQKKTGAIAGDVSQSAQVEENSNEEDAERKPKSRGKKAATNGTAKARKTAIKQPVKKRSRKAVKEESEGEELTELSEEQLEEDEDEPSKKKQKKVAAPKATANTVKKEPIPGERRSGRARKAIDAYPE